MNETENVAAAVFAAERREAKAMARRIGAGGANQLVDAAEVLAKHLRAAPVGATVGDVLAILKGASVPKPVYVTDEIHAALVAALTALDCDPAHPHPLSDRIFEVLGEVGGVWPACSNPDYIDQIATTPAEKRVAKRYRDILDANAKAMAMLDRIKPRKSSA